ncbi:type I-E CRISPR-associated endonuclease Cas1e [Streptomyces sp. NPDC088923]|uniref:type I-E CRISPR-associated endonuclease Cas1e n=1 Tax=Streptomyces sp. NPDC088923 TaxID=3365913 RepID=UPI0038031544
MTPRPAGPANRRAALASGTARKRIGKPNAAMLPRIGDSLSFLFLDQARVEQDATGVKAVLAGDDGPTVLAVPTAALSCLLLGPGTSITAPALRTLARHGTSVVITGSAGVRCYAGLVPEGVTSKWLQAQATAWADPTARTAIAERMYRMRFGPTAPQDATIATLRGLEGSRMKAMYKALAQQHHLPPFRRSYDPEDWDDQTSVNKALSAANSCLYGIVHAAMMALGISPGLGFVHTGTTLSFVYDIADLYKSELAIPLAFSLHDSTDPEGEARRSFREGLRLFKLLPRIVADLQDLFDPQNGHSRRDDAEEALEEITDLWDPELGALPGGRNYSSSGEN